MPSKPTTSTARSTPGTPATASFTFSENPVFVIGPNSVNTCRSEGLVLARYVGKDDCVRRAPATAAMATPPTRPMSSTSVR